jgi:hypothetical protein
MAAEVSLMCFWAFANTQQFWAHKSSLQLPIAYLALSLLELPLLVEPALNPVTEKPE